MQILIISKMQTVQYVFIDSGIGGLPYLKYLRKKEKNASAAYIADTKNFPYGKKTTSELKAIAKDLVSKVIKVFNPKIIIIACNTLSLASLKTLRQDFSIPFVGTVPAVKVAAEKTATSKIVLIASEKAIKDKYTKSLIEEFSSEKNFILKPEQDLIKKIEEGLLFESDERIESEIKPIIDFCIKNDADSLVLACTHFLIIEDFFKRVSAGKVRILESLNGVIKQTLKLSPADLRSKDCYFYTTKKCTKEEELYYKKIADYFDLFFGGEL